MAPTFSAIGIVATDLPASLAFYRELGFTIPPEADSAPHVDVDLPGGLRLMLDPQTTVAAFDPEVANAGSGRVALAFACDSPAEVDATYDRMTKAGHTGHLAPWDAVWGQRYAVLHDPDGNGVELFAALPTSS
jgi:catechol 2,3-dioxygenase-like lactoylglutathione lyase family enzyme